MIEPPALLVAPMSVAVSCIGLPMVTGVSAFVVSELQLEMLTCSGGTKSLISAVNESEERLLR